MWEETMAKLFDEFPYLTGDKILIKQMELTDVEALAEISHNENVYKYVPPFLYQKTNKVLETAIKNLNDRDFVKKKMIIAGIYLKSNPNRLVGLAEMFDYKKRENSMTFGYRLNESFWHQGIATEAIRLMKTYLLEEMELAKIKAFVMPQNIYSSKALLNNGFVKEDEMVEEHNWGGQDVVNVLVYTATR